MQCTKLILAAWLVLASATVALADGVLTSAASTSGGSITVKENDNSPSVSSVSSISFTNGTVTDNGSGSVSVTISGTGAPTDAPYITSTAVSGLSAEVPLSALSTGCVSVTTTTGALASRTLTGTSNEVTVTNGDCSGTPTFSLPAAIDLGGKTSFEVPNGAAPTTSVFGQVAGDNDAWAASRGAVQFYDGTANTYLLGVLASDAPANGECPKWNTGGTITWETCSGGGSGDVTAAATFGTDNVIIRSDGTSKGVQSTGISVSDTTNDITGAGSIGFGSNPGDAGRVRLSNNESICWEAATPGTDLCLTLNASDEFTLNAPLNLTGTAGATLLTGVTSPSAPGTAEQWYFYADSADDLPKYIYNGGSEQTFYTTANPQTTASTASADDNDTSIATTAYVQTELTNYAADSKTLTNTTLNTESTGNVLTIPKRVWFPAAGCNNATAGSVWDLPTANAPAAACVTGTNTQKGVLDFDQTTDESAQVTLLLPATWTGAIDANVLWMSATTTGSVAWCIQLISSADAETDDPAFPAQATGNCVSDAAKGTTNQLNVAALTGITATGVAAGELLHIQISRDPNETSTRTDNHAADARLVGVELIYRVTE